MFRLKKSICVMDSVVRCVDEICRAREKRGKKKKRLERKTGGECRRHPWMRLELLLPQVRREST